MKNKEDVLKIVFANFGEEIDFYLESSQKSLE